jgi:hypothetical protein
MNVRISRFCSEKDADKFEAAPSISIRFEIPEAMQKVGTFKAAELYDIFSDLHDKYDKTIITPILDVAAQIYHNIHLSNPDQMIESPFLIKVTNCGGCGCSEAVPCHAVCAGQGVGTNCACMPC